MAKAYAGIVGAVLLLVGIVGFMTKGMMGMTFYPAHNIIHIASGALGLAAALAAGGAYARRFAQVFGHETDDAYHQQHRSHDSCIGFCHCLLLLCERRIAPG